jgi:hypothetical protein
MTATPEDIRNDARTHRNAWEAMFNKVIRDCTTGDDDVSYYEHEKRALLRLLDYLQHGPAEALQAARNKLPKPDLDPALVQDALDKFDGTGKYNSPSNPCWHDGIYGKSLQDLYGFPSMTELREWLALQRALQAQRYAEAHHPDLLG